MCIRQAQPRKEEYESYIDPTIVARNALRRAHGFSQYQHVFGRDPDLPFEVLAPDADVIGLTMREQDDKMCRAPSGRSFSTERSCGLPKKEKGREHIPTSVAGEEIYGSTNQCRVETPAEERDDQIKHRRSIV